MRQVFFSKTRRSKYGSKSAVYNGRRYDSIKEASYACELDWLVKAGEIKEWTPQVTYELVVNGKKICGIRPDFRVVLPDGEVQIHEVKSSATMTDVWKVKWQLLTALINELEPEVDPGHGMVVVV